MTTKIAIRCLLLATVSATSLVGLLGCESSPKAAAPAKSDAKYAFWPAAPDEPRIQFIGAFNSSEDISPTKSSNLEKIVFGADAVQAAYVNKPYGVAIRDGKIYVCDIRAKAVVVMDMAKKQTRLVGVTGATRLERPVAIAAADDGQLYVVDAIHEAVVVFDKDERFTLSLHIPKLKPSGIAIFGDRLYISDMARQQVLIVDRRSGKELGAIGSVGDEDGQFRLPLGVSVDKAGDVYVSDMMRCRVQKFTGDGKFLATVGEQGDHAGGFARPKHLAVDSEGIMYVVDSGFQNVQMFNDKFQLLMHFGAAGEFPGAMNLPVGVAVTDTGLEYFKDRLHPGFNAKRLIVVANQFGEGKISVYALGDRKPNFSLADMTAQSAKIETGVGAPSAEALKFQNIGGIEPGADGLNPDANKQEDAPPPNAKRDEAKPAASKPGEAKPADSKPATPPKQ